MNNNTTPVNSLDDATFQLLGQVVGVIAGNHHLWIPILFAWACGFMYTCYMNTGNIKRKADREFRVYMVNFVVAWLVYVGFNFGRDMNLIAQATLAGAVAVLLPAMWFRLRRRRDT